MKTIAKRAAFVALAFAGVLGSAQAADGLAQYAFRATFPVQQSNEAHPETAATTQYAFRATKPVQDVQQVAARRAPDGYARYAFRAVTPNVL